MIYLASKLSNMMVSISLKKLVKIPSIKAQVMEFLGLEVEKKEKTNHFGLNIDMSPFLNKLSMPISLQELLKVPSISSKAVKCLGIQPKTRISKKMTKITKDTLFMIQTVMNKGDRYPPFYVSLEINELIVHKCMLYSGAEVNVIPYKVMNQLELTTTR